MIHNLHNPATERKIRSSNPLRGYVQLENMAKPKAWTRLLIVAEATADKLRKPASIRRALMVLTVLATVGGLILIGCILAEVAENILPGGAATPPLPPLMRAA